MEKVRMTIGIIAGVLLVSAVAWAVYMRLTVIAPRLDRICKEVVEPYIDLHARGESRSAYDTYASEEFKKQFSFDDVVRGHQEFAAANGKEKGREFVEDSSPFFEKEGESVTQVTYRIIGEKHSARVLFEVVPAWGAYRIVSTHVEVSPGNLRLRPF